MRSLLAAVAAALVVPALANAAGPTIVARDLPLGNARTVAAVEAPIRFDLVGLHWRGAGSVTFRTRSVGGRWSGWQPAAPEDDGPDAGSAEARRLAGWKLGSPYWTRPSARIEIRTQGVVRRVRAYYVSSPVRSAPPPLRRVQQVAAPVIVEREQWGANEAIRRAPPQYADGVHLAIVHHTAGTNSYTEAQSAAIVRGIEIYHVKGNGWNDIGYNFLVDK